MDFMQQKADALNNLGFFRGLNGALINMLTPYFQVDQGCKMFKQDQAYQIRPFTEFIP